MLGWLGHNGYNPSYIWGFPKIGVPPFRETPSGINGVITD